MCARDSKPGQFLLVRGSFDAELYARTRVKGYK